MASRRLILVSRNEQDQSFFSEVAARFGYTLVSAWDADQFAMATAPEGPPSRIIWDLDGAFEAKAEMRFQELLRASIERSRPDQVYLVCDQALSTYGSLGPLCPPFQH